MTNAEWGQYGRSGLVSINIISTYALTPTDIAAIFLISFVEYYICPVSATKIHKYTLLLFMWVLPLLIFFTPVNVAVARHIRN